MHKLYEMTPNISGIIFIWRDNRTRESQTSCDNHNTKRGVAFCSTGILLGCVSIWYSCRFSIFSALWSSTGLLPQLAANAVVVIARARSDHLRSVVGALERE